MPIIKAYKRIKQTLQTQDVILGELDAIKQTLQTQDVILGELDKIKNLIVTKSDDDDTISTEDDNKKQEPQRPFLGYDALYKLHEKYHFNTVLDLGAGTGEHSEVFLEYGKAVTAMSMADIPIDNIKKIIADFNTYEFEEKYDCIWCSHCLEHQTNVNQFLVKLKSILNKNGVLAITVPPIEASNYIVPGHINFWNAGILLYNLIMAGFDCSNARIKTYGYNVSVIVENADINEPIFLNERFDVRLKKYFPKDINWFEGWGQIVFNANIGELNWNN